MTIDTAIVLAAGEGTRLQPLTDNRPKPMLPAGNRPILEYVCDALVEAGIGRLVLVVGYKRDRVQSHFGHEYRDVPVEYVLQEKQLGSGHALLQARSAADGPMVVVNGDRVIEAGMVEAVATAFETGANSAALAVIERPDASQYGAVELTDDTITRLVEKPSEGAYRLINAGVYAFGTDVFDVLERTERREGTLLLTDAVTRLVEEERVGGVLTGGLWADATYPWDLLTVATEVFDHELIHGVERRDDDCYVAESATVHPDATLVGPVVVDADCEVGAGAVVGPTVALGRNVTVAANATVQRSVLDADCRVDPGATLVDCVAGGDVDVGAGSVVPGGPGDVEVGETVFRDERLGAVFGDRVRIGGAVRCVPGALVGTNATVGTGVTLRGNVPAGAEVRR